MSFTAGAGTRFVVTSASSQSSGTTLTGPITATAGTATTNTPAFDITQTWNNAGVTFTGFRFNITDTASNASSLLMDLQVGGTGRFRITKTGWLIVGNDLSSAGSAGRVYLFKHPSNNNDVFLYNNGETQLRLATQGADRFNVTGDAFVGKSTGIIGFSSTTDVGFDIDVRILRDAASTLAQRNGVNPQTFRIYNTFTDASNYERGYFTADSNGLTIGHEALGTGVKRPVRIVGPSLASAEAVSVLDMSQTWNTSGTPTALKLNITDTASNANSLLMDLQRNGTSMFSFTKGNRLNIGDASGTGSIRFNTLCGIENQFNNVVIIQNNTVAATFSIASGTTIATSVSAPYVRTSTAYTVATLPAAGTAGAGARAFVTDANATTFLSTVAGGGANKVPVVSDGTNWLIG